jgi:hypothetical protein
MRYPNSVHHMVMNQLFQRIAQSSLAWMVALLLGAVLPITSQALPSYARQTGSDCVSCHIGGFGPQLTPYGMRFKIDGYIDSDGSDASKVPLSAMLVGNLTRLRKAAADDDKVDGFKPNNNAVFQEASLFLAGRLADRVGSFSQVTYSGVDKKWALDQLDIRHTKSVDLNGQEATVGLSLNNNPTLTDPVNTLAQWRFPYVSSDFGYSPTDMTVPLVERLGGSVMGLNAYTFLKNGVYAEYGLYKAPSTSTLNRLNNNDAGTVKGLANYIRLAYLSDQKRNNWSAGLVYFGANMHPLDGDGLRTNGVTDNYKDFGVDGSYQFLGNRDHIFTLTSSYIHERRNLGYTYGVINEGDQAKTSANQFRLAGSYHYMQHYGATLGWFNNKATADSSYTGTLGTVQPGGGSLSNRADTAGYTMQVDWTPWGQEASWLAPNANIKLGMQYTAYSKYLGGSSYIDGSGNSRNAKDNNTLMFFIWTSI